MEQMDPFTGKKDDKGKRSKGHCDDESAIKSFIRKRRDVLIMIGFIFMSIAGMVLYIHIIHGRLISNYQVYQKQTNKQKSAIKKIDKHLLEQSANISKFGLQLDSLEEEAKKIKDELDNIQSYFVTNDKNIEGLKNSTNNNRKSVKMIEDKVGLLSISIGSLAKDLNVVKQQKEMMQTQLNKLQQLVNELQKHATGLRNSTNNNRKSVKMIEEKVSQLSTSIGSVSNNLNEEKQQKETMQITLNKLQQLVNEHQKHATEHANKHQKITELKNNRGQRSCSSYSLLIYMLLTICYILM